VVVVVVPAAPGWVPNLKPDAVVAEDAVENTPNGVFGASDVEPTQDEFDVTSVLPAAMC